MNFFWFREILGWVLLALREIGGWFLILTGFVFFYLVYEATLAHSILFAWPFTIIGIFVFRGGIHLLKVAAAAKICQQAQDRLYPLPPPGIASATVRQPVKRTV